MQDDMFGEVFGNPVTVNHVRIEPKQRWVANANGNSIQSVSIMFVDSTHSTPINLKEESKVTFEGTEYIVQSIDTFYADSNKVHHWEVVLT